MGDLAVSEETYLSIMNGRAARIAAAATVRQRRESLGKFAVLSIEGERLAVSSTAVVEIIRTPPLARLPGAPPHLPGVVQLRGALLAVLDLSRLRDNRESTHKPFLAVLTGPPGRLGLLADALLGFRELFADELTDAFGEATRQDPPVLGTTRDLLLLLDADRLLSDPRLVIEPSLSSAAVREDECS